MRTLKIVTALVLIAACGKSSDAPKPSAEQPEETPASPKPTTPPPSSPTAPPDTVGEVERGVIEEYGVDGMGRLKTYLLKEAGFDDTLVSGSYGVDKQFEVEFVLATKAKQVTLYAAGDKGDVTIVPLKTKHDPETNFAAIAGPKGGLVVIASTQAGTQDPGNAEVIRLRWDAAKNMLVLDQTWSGDFLKMPAWASSK